jgi:hypothetical protein
MDSIFSTSYFYILFSVFPKKMDSKTSTSLLFSWLLLFIEEWLDSLERGVWSGGLVGVEIWVGIWVGVYEGVRVFVVMNCSSN